jgi:hypothetical protein
MGEGAITFPNKHAAECGRPPAWLAAASPPPYFAYYENEDNEQFVLAATPDSVRLATGEDWAHTFELLRPDWRDAESWAQEWPALHLRRGERQWLFVALTTAARIFARYRRNPPPRS